MNIQIQAVLSQKKKALKVLLETKQKLLKCQALAQSFIIQNNKDIQDKQDAITALNATNESLVASVHELDRSITEAERIINPAGAQ